MKSLSEGAWLTKKPRTPKKYDYDFVFFFSLCCNKHCFNYTWHLYLTIFFQMFFSFCTLHKIYNEFTEYNKNINVTLIWIINFVSLLYLSSTKYKNESTKILCNKSQIRHVIMSNKLNFTKTCVEFSGEIVEKAQTWYRNITSFI